MEEIKGYKEAKLGLVRRTWEVGGSRDAGGAWFHPWELRKVERGSFKMLCFLISQAFDYRSHIEWGFGKGPWRLGYMELQSISPSCDDSKDPIARQYCNLETHFQAIFLCPTNLTGSVMAEFKFSPFQHIYFFSFPVFKDTFQRCFFWLRRGSSHTE